MLPDNFQKAIGAIKRLDSDERFSGAFVFGSAARGEVTEDSDLDAIVVTDQPADCEKISHPRLFGLKLDISFMSVEQIRERAEKEAASGRRPMVAESLIIFDKYGFLAQLKAFADGLAAPRFRAEDYPQQQFLIYHANDKVERNLEKDPCSALLAMNIGINDLLKIHYRINGRWWVSNKRLLSDLGGWDAPMAAMLRGFLTASQAREKFGCWQEIIERITVPMGGRMRIEDNVCECESCRPVLEELKKLEYQTVNQ